MEDFRVWWTSRVGNSFALNLAVVVLCILVMRGWPVPSVDETLYLLLPKKLFDPEYLLNDWTLSRPWAPHAVFNAVVGVFTMVLPIEAIGWLGRSLTWVLISVGLIRLGRRFELPHHMIGLAICLWLIYGQSLVAHENIISEFEAKSVAYSLLLLSLNGFLNQRAILPGLLLGLTFSFHPAVGMWAILSVLPALSFLWGLRAGSLRIAVLFTALGALPGCVVFLCLMGGGYPGSPEEYRFFATIAQSGHLDPLSWNLRDLFLSYVLLAFNLLHFRVSKENRSIRFITYFQGTICFWFSLGVAARVFEQYALLTLMPFRLFPVFISLFFFLHLMSAYRQLKSSPPSPWMAVIGFVAILSFGNPLGRLVDTVRHNIELWTAKSSDMEQALRYLAKSTPNGSIVISPPWRQDSWYLSNRAQIANWHHPPFNDIGEWRERLESMVGRLNTRPSRKEMEEIYNNLPEERIRMMASKYGAQYLVSKGEYSFGKIFDSGSYRVYMLDQKPNANISRQ